MISLRNISVFLLFVFVFPSFARQLESIGRGEIAMIRKKGEIFLSWRLLEDDPVDVEFDLYRRFIEKTGYIKINQRAIKTTSYLDSEILNGGAYEYKVVLKGERPEENVRGTYVFAFQYGRPYISIKLNTSHTPRNVGLADLDGDKKYDFVVKYPDFNVDPYEREGYWKRSPDPFKLEAYNADGRYMWTYDMGWAIETGTWYSPYLVYDVDGDGFAEIYTKAGEGDPRAIDGHVLEGPEYLVKIDGKTGKIIQRTDWLNKEGFETYNRWSRNFLGIAYLNGKYPSIVMQRGTYTIIKSTALDKDFNTEWYWESAGQYENYKGQGQHGMQTADIDGDGRDELVLGSAVLDDNGIPMWTTGLGHNDVGHVADIDPANPGLEIFYGFEKSFLIS